MGYPTTEKFSLPQKGLNDFLRWYDSVPTENVRQFDDGGGVGHRVKLNARKKAWFSVNHSMLSPMSPNACLMAGSLKVFLWRVHQRYSKRGQVY
jgi:hypothetical protein